MQLNRIIFPWAFLIILSQTLSAQNPILNFAKGLGGDSIDKGKSIDIDTGGNSFVIGTFQFTTDLDPSSNIDIVTSSGKEDIFVAKFNNSGNYQWGFSLGSAGSDDGQSITVDNSGNIYITGTFNNTIDFDPSPSSSFTLSSAGLSDIFVAKYSSSGLFQWAFSMGSNDADGGLGIKTDGLGNFALVGYFAGSIDADPSVGISMINSNNASKDGFIAKYNNNGQLQWGFNIGSSSHIGEETRRIACDALGNCYIIGYITGATDLDPSAGQAIFTPNAATGNYIAKYSVSGQYQWAFQIESFMSFTANDISTDSFGNFFITGSFSGPVDFDGSAASAVLNAPFYYDIFVAKYNSAGVYQWAINMRSVGSEGTGICTDLKGNCYITGCIFGNGDFDPSPTTYSLTGLGRDLFVAKYNGIGDLQWAFRNDCTLDNNFSLGICSDNANVYLTGYYALSADFDPSNSAVTLTTSDTLDYDVFVAKYSCTEPLPPINTTPPSNLILCAGENTTLSATGQGNLSWHNGLNNTIPIGSGPDFEITNLSAGNYTYYAESKTCNSSPRTAFIVKVNDCLGIEKEGIITDFLIYPNPATDFLKLTITNQELIQELGTFRIYNNLGQVIKEEELKFKENTFKVDLRELNNGVYFISLTNTSHERITKKMVIAK